MPKISVIVPVYNVEQYLSQCLDSIINQTFKDIEIICINDGSTDNSGKILKQYAQKDDRIKVLNQDNQGLSVARNIGLAKAAGEYISFIDSDDFIHLEFLEILYQAIIQSNCDIAGCDFKKIKKAKDTIKINKVSPFKKYNNALDVLLHKDNFIHFNVWNKLYTKKIISDIKFIDGMQYEDWVFNLCVFAQNISLAWINEKLYGYRISNDSIMRSSYNEKKIEDYAKGIEEVHKYFSDKAPKLWLQVKKSRISRTVKMMMNSALRSKKAELITKTKQTLRKLRNQNLITYHGLSLKNKIKLFNFLH